MNAILPQELHLRTSGVEGSVRLVCPTAKPPSCDAMVGKLLVWDECGSRSRKVDKMCEFTSGGDDVGTEIVFRFNPAPRHTDLVFCSISSSSSGNYLKKFADARLQQAEGTEQQIVADLPDGGKVYLDRLGSDGCTLECSRTRPLAQTQAPPGQTLAPPAQTVYAQQPAPPPAHAIPPRQMHAPPPASQERHSQPSRRRSSPPSGAVDDAKRPRRDKQVYGVGESGHSGQEIQVVTNFYPIRVDRRLRVSQYDLTLECRDGQSVMSQEKRRRIVSETPIHLVAPSAGFAYNGSDTLYVANGELSLVPEAEAVGWKRTEQGDLVFQPGTGPGSGSSSQGAHRRFTGTVTLKRAGSEGVYIEFERFLEAAGGDPMRAQMQVLGAPLAPTLNPTPASFRRELILRLHAEEPQFSRSSQVLDIVFKAQASSRCKTIGDAFYAETVERSARSWAERFPMSSRLNQLWLGYRTTTVYTKQGPMLQVDRAATCMLAPLRLEEFILQKLRTSRLELTTQGDARLSGVSIEAINKKLTQGTRNMKVCSDHRKSDDGRPLMEYVVRGLDTCRCDEARFTEVCGTCQKCNDASIPRRAPIEERCESPRETSVFEWFGRNFPGFPLRRPDLPCVLVGSQSAPAKVKLPLELLSILPGQPVQDNGPEVRRASARAF